MGAWSRGRCAGGAAAAASLWPNVGLGRECGGALCASQEPHRLEYRKRRVRAISRVVCYVDDGGMSRYLCAK